MPAQKSNESKTPSRASARLAFHLTLIFFTEIVQSPSTNWIFSIDGNHSRNVLELHVVSKPTCRNKDNGVWAYQLLKSNPASLKGIAANFSLRTWDFLKADKLWFMEFFCKSISCGWTIVVPWEWGTATYVNAFRWILKRSDQGGYCLYHYGDDTIQT